MLVESCGHIPVDDANGAGWFPFQVLGERRAANDPNQTAVPVKPDRRFARTMLGLVSQMCVQRP